MPYEHALADREQGQFPLSIATSLALESACNIHEELKHTSMPLLDYNEFWINLRTLHRNLMGSFKREDAQGVIASQLAPGILEEIQHIESIVKERNAQCKVVFYVSNYAGMERKYPHAVLRRDSTDKQKIYTEIQKQTITQLLQLLEKEGGHDVRVFTLKLDNPQPRRTLILTHYPYDLLSYYQFQDLVLLESHTGAIKPRSQFYTKYLDGKGLPMMPFREDLIQVFGDKETFRPMDHKARVALIELAKERRWTPVTSGAKIKHDIEHLKNHYLAALLKDMLV